MNDELHWEELLLNDLLPCMSEDRAGDIIEKIRSLKREWQLEVNPEYEDDDSFYDMFVGGDNE